MGFPSSVRNEVLVKCKRHCCLCGKYVGMNMELHHIKQKADGGNDTEDNCIPLCFRCHAEVRSYNPHHPKGLKYSEEELKQRRDQIYNYVKNIEICAFSDKDIKMAKKLLDKYYKIIEYVIRIDPCAEPVYISAIDWAQVLFNDLQSYGYYFDDKQADMEKCNLGNAIMNWCNLMWCDEYFHLIGNELLCFNSQSVNVYRNDMMTTRVQVSNAYQFLKNVALNRIL